MKKFEYRIQNEKDLKYYSSSRTLEKVLTAFGYHGWELVCITGFWKKKYIFKREII